MEMTVLPTDQLKASDTDEEFSSSTHYAIGIYLTVIGILGTLGNSAVLATFVRFRNLLTPTAVLLVNLAVADLGIILFGFPFSATSSFKNKWAFGETGCQFYAFMGFLMGSAHIGTLTLLAIDRYVVTCNTNIRSKLTYRRYSQYSIVIWLYAAFWSLMPLFGWGRYGLEPSGTTCTIDWRFNDPSYKSFMISYTLLGYVIPLIVIGYCYSRAANQIKSNQQPAIRGALSDKWANDKNVTFMCIAILITFVLAWTPYAILCMWTVFAEPDTVPTILTIFPPFFAKASTIINPFIYYFSNARLKAGIASTIACCTAPPDEINEVADNSTALNKINAREQSE